VNQTFKLGLAFSSTEALVAVNGQQTAKFSLNRNENFFSIQALEILKEENLNMKVEGVDFFKVFEADLEFFERFTTL
jgi:hypothetical protein